MTRHRLIKKLSSTRH